MIEYIEQITKARTLSCNNIRKKTGGIYDFLGYTVQDMIQWYRLNSDISDYTLCSISSYQPETIVSYKLNVQEVLSSRQLESFPFLSFTNNRPFKDYKYVEHRYFKYPWHTYKVYWLSSADKQALIILREITWQTARMLRIVDFIGERDLIKQCGEFVGGLIKEQKAEFVDWFAFGVGEHEMKQAGFSRNTEANENIIPLYLSPLLMKQTGITIFVSEPRNYMMFRADGDQDRPNLG